MSNFRINFTHPWLLLLLIPAVAFTLLPYFRIAKKYRRTRNRVVSIVLHTIVMFLTITLLAGLTFSYEIPNRENEILFLVDASYSNTDSESDKENFVSSVINDCGSDFRVGVVKFGYDQLYVAPMSYDADNVYLQFESSDNPDVSATDVAAALEFVEKGNIFKNPKTSKIVLISDGIETDGEALKVVSRIAAKGIKVDTVYFPNDKSTEIQIVGVETPNYNVDVGQSFNVKIQTKSNFSGSDQTYSLTVYDNDVSVLNKEFNLAEEDQTVEITHKFDIPGMHELRFEITNTEDTLKENNVYYSYMYLKEFKNILLIEKDEGEGSTLKGILTDEEFKVTDLSIEQDIDEIPNTIEALVDYEQVVLVNIANADMPAGFDELLYQYVHELGGGLFTVGGNNDSNSSGDVVPHAYNRDDMFGSLYQQMLPVQVVNYTPPIAVMIVIDSSGSMGTGPGSNLEMAKDGAYACLQALTSNDYCGVITFSGESNRDYLISPVTKRDEIEKTINRVGENGDGGSTVFSTAIDDAGRALRSVKVERRHIILVTDGQPGDKPEEYESFIKDNYAAGITMSVVLINYPSAEALMTQAAELGGGNCYNITNVNDVANAMYNDLIKNAIEEIKYGEEFYPAIGDHTAAVDGIKEADIPKLTGYYGTRLKDGAQQPLKGEYVPIYAQWKYGQGMVGSFMCDLNGTWSADFVTSLTGKAIVYNIVDSLFPTNDIQSKKINVSFSQDNYTSTLNVYTSFANGEKVEVTVTPLSDDAKDFYAEKPIVVNVLDGGTRYVFDITCPGLYKIDVTKKDANGIELVSITRYKTFSYSQEYNMFPTRTPIGEELMSQLAERGRGIVVEEYREVFDSFARVIEKTYDPRELFLTLAIVLFLLDVAVRKFKFKWPHEIIRDYKIKKASFKQ